MIVLDISEYALYVNNFLGEQLVFIYLKTLFFTGLFGNLSNKSHFSSMYLSNSFFNYTLLTLHLIVQSIDLLTYHELILIFWLKIFNCLSHILELILTIHAFTAYVGCADIWKNCNPWAFPSSCEFSTCSVSSLSLRYLL